MHNGDFVLDPQLAKDCFEICDLPLSKILLLNDSQYPWFVQVPRINHVSEIVDLNEAQQSQLWYESRVLSELLVAQFEPHKLNIAALGNIVSQLHVHHIVRYHHDASWPKPVWGASPSVTYDTGSQIKIIDTMRSQLEQKLC